MPTPFLQTIDGCLDSAIGAHGLTQGQLDSYLGRLAPELDRLRDEHRTRALPLLTLPRDTVDLADAEAALAQLSRGAEMLVFFGTGGSALGGQTLAQLAGWGIPGGGDPGQRLRPRTRFYDNLDGASLVAGLASLDLAKTRFVVTSKSGGTTETLAQAIAALSAVRAAGLAARIPDLFLGITEPGLLGKSNGLRHLFETLRIPLLEHHTGVGGRFSCLTNVGLMPALARGLDARAVRAGAEDVIQDLLTASNPDTFAPAMGAAVAVALAAEKGVRVTVMMPYVDRLGKFSEWYVQLWAESLGKNGRGTTPVAALGPLDQHSQLQLFMEGPHEHLITLVRTVTAGLGPHIDRELAKIAGLGFIGGRTVGDIVAAQAHALPEALTRAGRPVRTIDIPNLDARAMGALLMHFMLETILAGRLMGIDPFDQPGVELAKVLTRERLASDGVSKRL